MTLYLVPGVGYVDDTQQEVPHYGYMDLPDGSRLEWGTPGVEAVPTVWNRWQYSPSEGSGRGQTFQWAPGMGGLTPTGYDVAPGYLGTLLDYAAQAELGPLSALDREQWESLRTQAQAIPMRDIGSLYLDWQGRSDDPTGLRALNPGSPDVGAVMLDIRSRLVQGTASPQEATLYRQLEAQARDWDWRASVPQPSDAFSPLGDQFFQALNALTMAVGGAGSFGAFGAAGAAGAGAGSSVLGIPTSTLATIGTVGGYGAQGAGMLGSALQQPWLTRLAGALGAASGLAGGAAGLGNLAASGVQNVSDVGRLLQSTGRVTGALGAIPGADPLRQAGRYLGLAGQVGRAGGGAGELFQAAQEVQQGATQGGPMSEWDYSWDYGGGTPYDNWSWDAGATGGGGELYPWEYTPPQSQPYDTWSGGSALSGLSLEDQVRQAIAGRPDLFGADVSTGAGGGAGWLSSVLGGLGQVGSFLGKNASWLGPAVSGLTGLGAGALGSQAARDAAGAQSNALNRGIDLATAQWLQNQQNMAPWLEAGRTALGHLAGRSTWGGPQAPGATPAISGANYGLPSATPGWNPVTYQGPAPTSAEAYRSAAPQLYQGDMPATAIPRLTGQAVLNDDPGYQWRQDEARRALEASAAAKGGLVSGPVLAALQRQSSDLASQEYQNAWQRMMTGNIEQYGRNWNQYLQNWNQGVTGTQLGLQTNAQNFGQALAAQQAAFGQGLQSTAFNQQQQQQYANDLYARMMEQAKLRYGQDVYANETDYQRQQQAYQQQIAELSRQWGQFSTLAGLGGNATTQLGAQGQAATQQLTSLLGQLGNAQAGGSLGTGQAWLSSLGNLNNSIQGSLNNQTLLSALSTLNR